MDIKINLWKYQQEAIDNIFGEDGIYTKGGTLAEVILPTGAGKSYIALQAVLNVMEAREPKDIQKDGVISDTELFYLSPRHLILKQFRRHMVNLVMKPVYTELEMPQNIDVDISNVDSFVNNILSYFDIDRDTFDRLDYEEIQNLTPREIVMETVDRNLKKLSDKKVTKLVKKAFPNFDFRCYASTKSKKGTIKTKKTMNSAKRRNFR